MDVDEEEISRNEDGTFPDSYLYVGNWGKGVAFVNGFNLGWYWPSRGPANTMCALSTSINLYTVIEKQMTALQDQIIRLASVTSVSS